MMILADCTDPVRNLRVAGQYIKDHAAELIGDYKNEPITTFRVVIDLGEEGGRMPRIYATREILVLPDVMPD